MTSKINKILLMIAISLFFSSCGSLINKIAVKSTGGILSTASDEVLQEGNWEAFYYGVPGNLKLMEALFFIVPDDRNILSSLVKGYAGYAFVVNETLALDEEYNEADIKPNHDQAIYNYSKAVSYGNEFLKTYGLSYEVISQATKKPTKLAKLLKSMGTSKFELETLFFVAQAYGGLILFNRDDMSLVAKRPMVQAIFDHVCGIMPDINGGACDIFYGANLVLTPAMMGGNPERGREIFEKAMKKYPDNYFIRSAYLQFYAIPFEEEELFEENLKFLSIKEKEFKARLEFNPNRKDNRRSNLNLFQAVAFKRLEIMKRHSSNFF